MKRYIIRVFSEPRILLQIKCDYQVIHATFIKAKEFRAADNKQNFDLLLFY